MMGSHAWHGKAPNDEQLETAFKQLYWKLLLTTNI
jgi:transketolase